MVRRKWAALFDYLRGVAVLQHGDVSDAALLDRFIGEHDEVAFTQLFDRHRRLVWGVCARVLGNTPDAEDAFQATFLVLLRKAHAIGKRSALRSWLHGVAYRVAVRARANRRCPVPVALGSNSPDPLDNAALRELRIILDNEISRLPERLKQAVILCYLEGHTHDEAAELLGCPRGTIASQLSRARSRLRNRLAQRGFGLAAGAFASLLGGEMAHAASTTPTLATVANLKIGAVSDRVLDLAEGVIRAMLMIKFKPTILASGVLLLACVLVAVAVGRPGQKPGEGGVVHRDAPGKAAKGSGVLEPKDPLDAARKASIEAADIRSAAGTALFEEFVQERGTKEATLRTRAKVKVAYDRGKYLLRFAYETKLQRTVYETPDGKVTADKLVEWKPREFIILYDGQDAYAITFADKISPAGCMMEIHSGFPVEEFSWKDAARLGTQILNVDGIVRNIGQDAVKMTKLAEGGYRGSFHLKNAPNVRCTFDVAPEFGFNVTATTVTNAGDRVSVERSTAKWQKIEGRWYALEHIKEFDNRHLSDKGLLQKSVFRYEKFEPGATIDAKQFTLESLPIPEKVYRLDRRQPREQQ
jgi:RNA polymerase sigma factor (sigma-70 family)